MGRKTENTFERLMDIYKTRQRMRVNNYIFEKSSCHHIGNVSYLPWVMDVVTHRRL